ncbi:MAG TPA: histidine kinase [Actinomycetota bacterium]
MDPDGHLAGTAVARSRARIAWVLAIASIALMAGSFSIKVATGAVFDAEDTPLIVPGLLGGIAFAVVGALIASRAGNAVGWVFLGIAASFAVATPAQNWVDAAIEQQRPLAHVGLANWLAQWPFFLCIGLLPAVFFLFPTGSLPSTRWRLPWRVYVASLGVTVVGFALLPYRWDGIEGVVVTNPLGIERLEPVLGLVLAVAGVTLLVSGFVALASLIVRARSAGPEERQQIRWLGAVGKIGGVLLILTIVAGFTGGNRETGFTAVAANILMVLLVVTVVVGIPLATAVAIFRYRLYSLDLVVKKAVIFAITVALIMVAGFAVLLLITGPLTDLATDSPLALGITGLVIGALVVALWRLANLIADRLVYGRRATPYEALTEFSERLSDAYATDDVLPRMAAVLGETVRAAEARVWLRVDDTFRPAAAWPADAPPTATVLAEGDALPDLPGADVAVEVRHHGALLGALSVTSRADDPVGAERRRLMRDLAAQAGLVLRNVRLIEELRASRQRLVAAQDEERRRLERNIHDGAQQQLVALGVKLRLADSLMDRDPAKTHELMSQLQQETTSAIDDLRDLARGIYPPLLADRGLEAALEAQARKSTTPVDVTSDGVGRYGQDVEAAVYFSCLEALQNVAKYASASSATIRLAQRNGSLEFAVSDDGTGFDPDVVGRGSGLQGMADRLDAIGGELAVESSPGSGTIVRGSVPI